MQSRGITLNTDRAASPHQHPPSLSLSHVSASIVDTRYSISEEKLDNEQPERLLLLWLLQVRRCFDCDELTALSLTHIRGSFARANDDSRRDGVPNAIVSNIHPEVATVIPLLSTARLKRKTCSLYPSSTFVPRGTRRVRASKERERNSNRN